MYAVLLTSSCCPSQVNSMMVRPLSTRDLSMPEGGANNQSTTRVPLYAQHGSRPAPLSTMLRGALEGLPSALGARAELWARRGCRRVVFGGSRGRVSDDYR